MLTMGWSTKLYTYCLVPTQLALYTMMAPNNTPDKDDVFQIKMKALKDIINTSYQ